MRVVHKVIQRKGASWKSGQKIKALKVACPGCHKNNMYATLEYVLLEGFQEMLVVSDLFIVDKSNGFVFPSNLISVKLNSGL